MPQVTVQSLPLHHHQILLFISYLHLLGRAPATITTYVAALGFVHKFNNQPDPTNTFIVQKTLSTVNKKFGKPDNRLPITQFILQLLLDSIQHTIGLRYHQILLHALFTTAFYGLFRVGELTIQNSGEISLYLKQVTLNPSSITISITQFKNNPTKHPFDIVLNKQTHLSHCPYTSLLDYLDIRGTTPGPLFAFPDNKPVPRTFFTSRLKTCLTFSGLNPQFYLSHSFRIGSASYLASVGLSDLQIKIMGRWNSDSFVRYIRNQKYNV